MYSVKEATTTTGRSVLEVGMGELIPIGGFGLIEKSWGAQLSKLDLRSENLENNKQVISSLLHFL